MKWSDYPIQKVELKQKNYPTILKEIKNPPKTLFYRGNLDKRIFKKSLAIVGSRRMTRYGKMVIERLMPTLVTQKITIISGFMYGVDSEAHQKCLENGGSTIAIFGCGLNVVYPEENQNLYTQILESGGIVFSEYESEVQPQLWTFPQRNRIIAGLATLGVLVIEAGEKSGSLITARLAQQQGKKLFAIPGPITASVSKGTNLLIQKHRAKMVLTADDILGKKTERLSLFSQIRFNSIEKKIYQALEAEPLTVDELAKIINKNVIETGKTLSLMALKGLVSDTAGKYYLSS